MSRDGCKSKFKDLKATVKGYKNRPAHLTRSREQWRIRAERAGEQITTLEVEIAALTTDCWGPFARAERLAPGRHHALSGEPPRCSNDNGLVPGPIRRHGVELHVPRRGQEVVFIHDGRGEAALPQVPSPALPEVDPPRVPAMCLANGATQALGGLRDNDQVNMIGHQAICPDRDLLCAAESRR